MTARGPSDGREVVGHLALAVARYLRESRSDGVWVPPEVESLVHLLTDCARQRQEETTFGVGSGVSDAEVMDTLLLTRREAASWLRCSVRTVDRLIAAGRLCAVKVEAGSTRIRRADLGAFVDGLPPRSSFRDSVSVKDGAA